MVREPDATMQPTPQDNQLTSKHRVLSLKPQFRLEWRGQDGKNETEQPDHSVNLRDSITASTRMRFSVHTGSLRARCVVFHDYLLAKTFAHLVGERPRDRVSCSPRCKRNHHRHQPIGIFLGRRWFES
jgi:hypothetical protein